MLKERAQNIVFQEGFSWTVTSTYAITGDLVIINCTHGNAARYLVFDIAANEVTFIGSGNISWIREVKA